MRAGQSPRRVWTFAPSALGLALAACLSGPAQAPRVPPRGKAVVAKEYGTLRGRVTWKGRKPDRKALTDQLLKQISSKDDRGHCLAGPEDHRTQQGYRIGKNEGLGNVFVWVRPENPRDWFVVPKKQLDKFRDTKVEVRQPYCAFVPHCLVLFPEYRDKDGKEHPTGQVLVAVNDSNKARGGSAGGISHNTKVQGGARNPEKGQTLPPGEKDDFKVAPEDREIVISCNIHPWMRAYARAFTHPWATVTRVGKDEKDPAYGTYEIKGVPMGVRVRVVAWHERLGFLAGPNGKAFTRDEAEPGAVVNFTARLGD